MIYHQVLVVLKDYINAFLSLGPRFKQTSDVHVLWWFRSSYTVHALIKIINTPINNTYESCMGGALLESEKLPFRQNGAQNLYTKV